MDLNYIAEIMSKLKNSIDIFCIIDDDLSLYLSIFHELGYQIKIKNNKSKIYISIPYKYTYENQSKESIPLYLRDYILTQNELFNYLVNLYDYIRFSILYEIEYSVSKKLYTDIKKLNYHISFKKNKKLKIFIHSKNAFVLYQFYNQNIIYYTIPKKNKLLDHYKIEILYKN
jgi:hypothetical protein